MELYDRHWDAAPPLLSTFAFSSFVVFLQSTLPTFQMPTTCNDAMLARS